MNNILLKCIEELKKPKANKHYVIGMLEALADTPIHTEIVLPKQPTNSDNFTNVKINTAFAEYKETSESGEMETPEERKVRLSRNKVPPAFLGNISKMHLDPSLTDGKTDVVPQH